jgi:hypothetical protein
VTQKAASRARTITPRVKTAPQAKISAPTTEIGFVNPFSGMLSGWASWDTFEQVPELIWPNSVRTFTRMSREDGRIASIIGAIGLPIRRTAWRIDQAGASDVVTKFVAQNLGLPIRGAEQDEQPTERMRDRFSWPQHLQQALLMLVFGHSVFEQVYRKPTGVGEFGDKMMLGKLAPRPAQTIAFWDVARDGGLNGIMQYPEGAIGGAGSMYTGGAFDNMIPVSRLVAYVRDPDPGVWTGNSLLRPAYKHWLLKDELIRIHAAMARRNGMGVPVAYNTQAEAEAGVDLTKYQKIASSFRGGNTAGVAMPYGSKLEIIGVTGVLPADIPLMIEYHDKQMALAALAHFLNLDKGGSYALASVQADAFTQSIQTIAEIIRDTAQAHIVEDLVDLNFGKDEPAPKITIDEIGSRQDATAAALQMLVTAGIITVDPRLEAFERQTLGLPSKDPDADDADDAEATETDAPESAAPPVPESNVANAAMVPVRDHYRRRPRATIEPNGAMTLW